MKVGILALQGAVGRHSSALAEHGVRSIEIRLPRDLAGVDAVVLPGGESTTMSRLLVTSGLLDPLAEGLAAGLPAFGTCAGMILLAADVSDGRLDQRGLGAIDIGLRRNAYGRQVDSFEAGLPVTGLERPFRGVFIRAPVVERVGPAVEVLASIEGRPVLCREGPVLAASFHPELAGDSRLHGYFLDRVVEGVAGEAGWGSRAGPAGVPPRKERQ